MEWPFRRHRKPTGMRIREIYHHHHHHHWWFPKEDKDVSTPAGGTSVFQELPTPPGSVFPPGTTFAWTVDDTADISLVPSSDGTHVSATCVAAPTGTSYNLTCTSSFTPSGASAPISATLNVPIVVVPTGMVINQLS